MAASSIAFSPNPGTKARQLFVLLHGEGGSPDDLEPLGLSLRMAFPGAVVLIPTGFVFGEGAEVIGDGSSDDDLPAVAPGGAGAAANGGDSAASERVTGVLPAFIDYVRRAQQRLRLHGRDTAIGGFSLGAVTALEAAQAEEALAGRVLAFGGRYASLPSHAPRYTTIHLLHGADDAVVPVLHAKAAHGRLAQLRADATIDVASNVGHELHPALVERAIVRLKTCVPLRDWQTALQGVPVIPPGPSLH